MKNKQIILATLLTLAMPAMPVWAGDFPGVGDPHGWSDALPYYNRGNRYLNQQRWDDAARDFQEAIARYPHDPDFYINLGVALRKLDNYTGAEQAFKSATELNPKDWTAWSNLGNAYLKQNRLKDTIGAFERALKCNPPASEKEAMHRDIADIHKILRATGQEPFPEPAKSGKPGAGKSARSSKKAPAAAQNAARKPASVATKAPGAPPKANPGAAKDWGYD